MNRFLIIVGLTSLVLAGFIVFPYLAFAQTKPSIPAKTPLAHYSQPTPTTKSIANPDVNSRMQKDMEQIQEDLHSGKLSDAQATGLRNKVKVVRKRELGFFKANGNPSSASGRSGKYLTDGQKSQLGQDLAVIESSI